MSFHVTAFWKSFTLKESYTTADIEFRIYFSSLNYAVQITFIKQFAWPCLIFSLIFLIFSLSYRSVHGCDLIFANLWTLHFQPIG